jgi:hypothetical protein
MNGPTTALLESSSRTYERTTNCVGGIACVNPFALSLSASTGRARRFIAERQDLIVDSSPLGEELKKKPTPPE